jgi:hypothetical protein
MKSKALWTCPSCARQFANRNQTHSCGAYTVAKFLRGKSPRAIRLYRRFAALVARCGPVRIAPAKTRIGFQVRMIFASVNRLSQRGLDAHVVLTRRLADPRFARIEPIADRCFVHHFRITSPAEMDAQVAAWMREAYRVGQQAHLR